MQRKAAGGATRTKVRDRSRLSGTGAGDRREAAAAHCAGPRRGTGSGPRVIGELAGLADRAAAETEKLLANACQALRRAQTRAAQLATRWS
jgi:hypothetical protein